MQPLLSRMCLALCIGLVTTASALALMPLARPEAFPDFDPGFSGPFNGGWSITIPTMDVNEPDTVLAICKLPVRIVPDGEAHILYSGPGEAGTSTRMELRKTDGGAQWVPAEAGPSFFAFWVAHDVFYLYEHIPQADADWGRPYVYRRCPAEDY